MLVGYKWNNGGFQLIKVGGYKTVRYLYCSKREAEKLYRERFGLKGQKIKWETGTPTTFFID